MVDMVKTWVFGRQDHIGVHCLAGTILDSGSGMLHHAGYRGG
jgi:hypothetical protein